MTTGEHHGVGAIVTNAARTRFFIQQKDADYPHFPLAYSTFGGAREAEESPAEALDRELGEELGEAATTLAGAAQRHVSTTRVGPSAFTFSLFEITVDDPVLDALARAPVAEGERGAVFKRAELRELPFVWGLEQVIAAYLDGLAPR